MFVFFFIIVFQPASVTVSSVRFYIQTSISSFTLPRISLPYYKFSHV